LLDPAQVDIAVFSAAPKPMSVFTCDPLRASTMPVAAVARPNIVPEATFAILANVTELFAIVAENVPVPEPVTSPISVIVWSPVFVPLLDPLNVPDWVANVPSPKLVLACAAVVAPVPPLAIATVPETFEAIPVVFWLKVGHVKDPVLKSPD
jgi:hypothetical protein